MEEKKDDLSSHLQWFRNRNSKKFFSNNELPTMNKPECEEASSLQIRFSLSSLSSSSPASSTSTSWLKTALSELDEKTQEILKLIEEDAADSFAKRAEMYYKTRPRLVQMVQDFHRAHRSLEERYQLIMSKNNDTSYCEPPSNSPSTSSSSSSSEEDDIMKSNYPKSCSSYYATDESSSMSSEISNPDEVQQLQKESEIARVADNDSINNDGEELMLVRREEMESLVEENKKLKEQMMHKDEEKREAIRQLCLYFDLLREEHENSMEMTLRKNRQNHATHDLDTSDHPKMSMFWGRLFLNF